MSFKTALGQRNYGLLFLDNEKYLFFFHKSLVEWLHENLTNISSSSFQMMHWNILFAYGIWQLWLSRNNRIFNPPFEILNQLMHKALHLATEFYHLAYHRKIKRYKSH